MGRGLTGGGWRGLTGAGADPADAPPASAAPASAGPCVPGPPPHYRSSVPGTFPVLMAIRFHVLIVKISASSRASSASSKWRAARS